MSRTGTRGGVHYHSLDRLRIGLCWLAGLLLMIGVMLLCFTVTRWVAPVPIILAVSLIPIIIAVDHMDAVRAVRALTRMDVDVIDLYCQRPRPIVVYMDGGIVMQGALARLDGVTRIIPRGRY